MSEYLPHPYWTAVIVTVIFESVRNWRLIFSALSWFPSELIAEFRTTFLRLPDNRDEKPDYSGWQFINTTGLGSSGKPANGNSDKVVWISPFSWAGAAVFLSTLIFAYVLRDYVLI